jgi:Flp pilus assembly protein TadD
MSGGCPKGIAAVRCRLSTTALVAALLAIAVAGCASVSRRATPGGAGAPGGGATAAGASTGAAGSGSVEQYAATIKANSQRSDHESDAKVRADLAAQSSSAADACLALDPQAAACQYGKAVASGMVARAHPARGVGLLSGMLQNLGNADSSDPNYDKAGPSRVRALVLIRAPGWPVGPGDTEAGLAAARRAVSLQPDYPPNVLALAEALSKTGDEKDARDNYAHVRDLAQSLPPGPDRDEWLRDAENGLQHK